MDSSRPGEESPKPGIVRPLGGLCYASRMPPPHSRRSLTSIQHLSLARGAWCLPPSCTPLLHALPNVCRAPGEGSRAHLRLILDIAPPSCSLSVQGTAAPRIHP